MHSGGGVSRLRVAAVALCFSVIGMLAACAGAPAVPRITALSSSVSQQGKPATITAEVENWEAKTQLALMPAGPYVTHRLALSSPPQAMTASAEFTFISTADQQLSIIDFPPQTNDARVLGRVMLAAPAKQLHLSGQRLLAVLVDGRLQWLDVSNVAAPEVLQTIQIRGKVRDVSLNLWLDGVAMNVLVAVEGQQTQLQQWLFSEGKPPRLLQQWMLPVDASAIAVRNKHVWVVDAQGINVFDISGEQAKRKDAQITSGVASDMQIQNQLALVSDGRGGLVVFDISQPSKLIWRGSFNKRGAIRGFSANRGKDNSALLTLQNGGVLRLGLNNPELPSSGAAFYTSSPVLMSDLQGDVAVLASQHSLQRVMMLGGGDGAISPEGLNLGGSRRGVIRDDILYVADWFSGLHLYDISHPQQMHHIANYHTPGSSKGVTLLGHYALVGDDDQGLQIIDIEDPHQPKWTAELSPKAMDDLGLAYTMKLVGKVLYLADHRGGFHIIDLHDIHNPRRLGGYDTPGKAWDIDVKNNVAFVADDRAGLVMFDVSDPAKPEPFAQFNPGGQAEDVALQGDRAYVAFFDKGLYTLDVSDPRNAKVIGRTPIPGNARGIELGDGLIYVASWEAGLQVVNTHGPRVPKIIGSFDTDGAAWGVKVKDGFAYVLDWWGGIKVVDVRQPSRPVYVSQYQARSNLKQLRTKDTYLYAASGPGGLQVYDIKNPLNPIWLKGLDLAGDAQDLWIEDERIYVATGDGGAAIFDILDPFYTRQIGSIDTLGEATKVVAANEYLYIADSQSGLLVMDVRDLQKPVEVERHDVSIQDMWLDEEMLWLVHTGEGLTGWKVAEDGSLTQQIRLPGVFSKVRAQGGLLAASTLSGRVKLWRHTTQGLVAQGVFVINDALTGLQLDGSRLYVASQKQGLSVVDITQPQSPRLVAVYPATGNHQGITIARGAAFFSGEPKLASVTLLPTLSMAVKNQTMVTLQIPASLPNGEYHLLAVGPKGRRQLFPNAFRRQFAPPGKKNTRLDAFRRLLKTPLKPPPEVRTDLPASL